MLLALLITGACTTAPAPSTSPPEPTAAAPLDTTTLCGPHLLTRSDRFVLCGDPAMSLHHFLYQWTLADHPGERSRLLEVVERQETDRLTPDEAERWRAALAFYAEHWAGENLVFDRGLTSVRAYLAGLGPEPTSGPAAETLVVLESVEDVYRRVWWPAHDAANRRWASDELLELVRRHEDDLAGHLAAAYGGPWPEGPVRVDVAPYSSVVGAYTTTREPLITAASLEPASDRLGAFEMLFHEVSHSGLQQSLLGSLARAFEEQGAELPRGLDHVVIFHTAGHFATRALAKDGHEYVSMDAEGGIYRRNRLWHLYRGFTEKHWQPYLDGDIDREEALSRLAAALAEDRRQARERRSGGR